MRSFPRDRFAGDRCGLSACPPTPAEGPLRVRVREPRGAYPADMPGELTHRGEEAALEAALGLDPAVTTYLALLTADPGDNPTVAGLAEITAAGYARQAVTWSAPAGTPRRSQNTTTLTFGPFGADPPAVSHAALVTSASGTTGEVRAKWAAEVVKDVGTGDVIQVAAGALSLDLD